MTPFIITGMPRARTAWLANYLTTGEFKCLHEFFAWFPTIEQGVEQMLVRGIGISDSGAVWFQKRLRGLMPDAKWVIITRDPGEVSESLQEASGYLLDLSRHVEKVEEACGIPGALVVEFEEISARILEIARFCFPDWVHDEDRHRQMLSVKIELRKAFLKAEVAAIRHSILEQMEP